MALEGNLRDFGLDAIFQLIANNRNTGVLTFESTQDEKIKISFIQGQVVWADTQPKKVEDRLGYVLVRSGALTEARLQEALELQKQTLQRLGAVLIEHQFVNQKALREALRTQVLQIVYRLFRWSEGEFKFLQEEEIDYDRENFDPIRSDHILMEGMRMLDEWPRIEKKIPNFKKVFRKVDGDDALLEGGEAAPPTTSEGGFDFSDVAEEAPGAANLPREEALILARVDGVNSVRDIIDRVPLTEFDVCRVLYDLIERGTIEEKLDQLAPGVGLKRKERGDEESTILVRIAMVLGILIVAASLATSWLNPLNTFYFAQRYHSLFNEANYGVSRNRLERIDWALKAFYLNYQRYPDELESLYERNFVEASDLTDPWGRPYEYTLTEAAYLVLGRNEASELDSSLRVYYEFGAPVEPVEAEEQSEEAEEQPVEAEEQPVEAEEQPEEEAPQVIVLPTAKTS
jgi:hypothetical protein